MAITILPKETGVGEQLGTALGTGLSSGLQNLAALKLQQMQKQQGVPGLQALGFAPQEASSLAILDPVLQREIIKQKLQTPQQQAFAQALSGILQPETTRDQFGTLAQPSQSFQQQQLSTAGLKPQQALQLAQLSMQQQQISKKAESEAFKQTKQERKEIIEKARSARQNIHDLERLSELEREGKLDTPGYVEFLKRSGLDVPALMNPGSEEFNKIAASFLRDAKTYLGARISNYELEQFLKTIPNLSQSPEGRKRVIANLKNFNRIALSYNEALKEVMAEHKGVPPLDLSEKIEDKVEKKIDKLSDKLKEDLAKPVPQAQNKLTTALQTATGTGIGRLPRAAGGAALGYKLGGPWGAAAGGLAGLAGLGVKDLLP